MYEYFSEYLDIVLCSAEENTEETPVINWSAVATGTYGQTWKQMVDVSGCSATLNGADLSGTFEVVNGETVPNVGDKYRLKFMSEDSKVHRGKRGVFCRNSAETADNYGGKCRKVYDGEPLVRNSYMAEGVVNGDKITKIIVSGTLTDAKEMPNVPSDAKNKQK